MMARGRKYDPLIDKPHPLVEKLFVLQIISGMSIPDLSYKSGVPERCLRQWRYGETQPRFDLLIAAFGALDYELVPTRLEQTN
jgi:hypothetical protein